MPALSVPVLAVFFGAETGGLALAGGATASALASDTVFAAIMIVCNGVVGLCVLVGGLHHRVVVFRVDATSPTLAALVAVISLWFPHPLVLGLAPKEIVLLALSSSAPSRWAAAGPPSCRVRCTWCCWRCGCSWLSCPEVAGLNLRA